MSSHDQQLRNPRYRDWVKAGLALKYLKDGIQEFVDDEIKDQQKNILEEVQKEIGRSGATCNSCPIDQLLAHKRGRYKKGNFCPYDVCDRLFDKIVEQHMYGRPSWSNSDSTKWCTDHWEMAKCFIDGGGYGDKVSASDTDCKGLLSIITNSMFVQRNVDTPIDKIEPKRDIFSQSKEARNKILHLASLQLPVETLNSYIDVMIRILEDKGKLHELENAKHALLHLRQLKDTDLYISSENEWEIREAALKAVQEKKQDALDEIEKMQNEVREKLHIYKIQETLDELSKTSKETSQSLSNRQDTLEQRQTLLECTLKQTQKLQEESSETVDELKLDVANLKKDFSDLKARFDAFDEVELQHKKRVTYLDHKKVVRQELFSMYSKYLSKIPVPPLLQKLDATVDEFYMELKICDDDVYEKRSNVKKNNYRSYCVRNFREIFYKEMKRVENIYVLGYAGVGKTTWCLKLIDTWLRCPTNQETKPMRCLSLNEKMMLEFDIVLFVSLRHASKDVNITDMIRNQIFHQTPQLLEYMQEVMNIEPERILVIADGLDEWNAPDDRNTSILGNYSSFPSRKNMNHCTVLTTTRPWKLNEAQPSYSEIDRAVIIQGFGGNDCVSKLAEKVIYKLNQNISRETSSQVKNEKKVEDFENELHKRFSYQRMVYDERVTRIPLILIIMVVKWYNDGCLEGTMAGNYSFMLKSLFEHEEGYRNIKPKYGRKQKLDGRLSLVSYIEEAMLKWSTDAEKLPECVRKHTVCCQYSRLILKLSEIAFEGLFDRNNKALIFSEESLLEKLSPEEIEVAVKSGILSKSDIVGFCNVSKLSFLHKTVQEFLAAIHLVAHHEDDTCSSFKKVEGYCSKYGTIYEMENVILFISGLDANLTVKILQHVAKVGDPIVCFGRYKYNHFDFVLKCIEELREVSFVASMPMVPLNSFIYPGMRHLDECLDLLQTSVDKGSIKYMVVDMFSMQGMGPNRLLDILSSEMFQFLCLTTLKLEGILGKCLHKRINKGVVFNLHNLRNLDLRYINIKNTGEERFTNFVLDFSHSRDIERVYLDDIFSCQINFSGTNLKEMRLQYLKRCHVTIHDGFTLEAEQSNSICILNCLKSKVCIHYPGRNKKTNEMVAQIASLTCEGNEFCEIDVDPNIDIESVVMIRKNIVPKLPMKQTKYYSFYRNPNKETRKRYNFENNIETKTFYIDKNFFTYHQAKHLDLKGSNIKITEFENETISIFPSVETLNLSNLPPFRNNVYKSIYFSQTLVRDIEKFKANIVIKHTCLNVVQSFVNLKCLQCKRLTERDFVMLGDCFQYLKNLKELELSNFRWNNVVHPTAFSCLGNIKNLKTLSFWDLSPVVISAISAYLPTLSFSELLLDTYFPGIMQCLIKMKMLSKLTVTSPFYVDLVNFIGLMKTIKQIKSLLFLKHHKCPIFYLNSNAIERIDLSGFAHLRYFSIHQVCIKLDVWQTFVKGLPKNGELQILEFPRAVIYGTETKESIKSTPGFVCRKLERVRSTYDNYNIILDVK